jgi:hypothetical protein
VTDRRPVTVIVNVDEEMCSALFRVEEWLTFTFEPETEAEEARVKVGARAAGRLGMALAAAAKKAPAVYEPDGRSELAPLVLLAGDLRAALAAIHDATRVAHLADPPVDAHRTLDLLGRAVMGSRTADARTLAVIAGSGRGPVTLNADQYQAYGRFVRAVLVDPLDRFAAMPPAEPERSARPELGP